MRVIAKRTLESYWREQLPARSALETWLTLVEAASWTSMDELRRTSLGRPSPVTSSRVVFNIHHNEYRLIADIDFNRQVVFIKFIGTHEEYDEIDPKTVSRY